MEKTISIPIPRGYKFDFVGTREVYFKRQELPDTVEGCSELMGNKTSMNVMVPNSDDTAVKALCNLLICRRVWWQQLGWLPNWEDADKPKYFISTAKSFSVKVWNTKDYCLSQRRKSAMIS